MPIPLGLPVPVLRVAKQRYGEIAEDTTLRDDVRDTCLVALAAVGRMVWENSTVNVPNMHKDIYNWETGVNCWSSTLKFAALSGAMTPLQYARLVDLTNGPSSIGMGQVQKNMVEWIYDGVPRTKWTDGCTVPVGAMVYHSRFAKDNDNPIAHCTLHVGNNMIVGSWRANVSPISDPVLYNAIVNLTERGWSGDTLYTPIDAFGDMQWLSFSKGPFWDYLG